MHHSSIAVDRSAGRNQIEVELISLLGSSQFRNSKQSSAFLRYVVQQALDGNSQTLKERTIGAFVFGRSEDYDTSNDSFVRVRANDVRRRLSCYYESNVPRAGVRIELEPGTYVPLFRDVTLKPAAMTPPVYRSRWNVAARLLPMLLFGSREIIEKLVGVIEANSADAPSVQASK